MLRSLTRYNCPRVSAPVFRVLGTILVWAFGLLATLPASAQQFCPNRHLVQKVNAALAELESLKACDAAAFERIEATVQPLAGLDPQSLDPVCRGAVKRAQSNRQVGLGLLRKRRHECSLVTFNLVFGYKGSATEANLEGLTLNGSAVRGSQIRVEPGRQQFVLAHTPSSGHQHFEAAFRVDQSPLEPVGRRDGELTYVTNALPGQELELAVEISGKQFLPSFVVASVTQDPNSTAPAPAPELLSRQAIRLQLGTAPLAHDGGRASRRVEVEVDEGPNELVVQHPAATDDYWYHLRAELGGLELPVKTSRPGRTSFEMAGVPGQTADLKLLVDTGPKEDWVRPYAIWGGGAVAVLGATYALTKLLEALDKQKEKDDYYEVYCALTDCSQVQEENPQVQEARQQVEEALQAEDNARTHATVSAVLAGLGAAAFGVGYFLLEPGIEDPLAQASVRIAPLFGSHTAGAHLIGHW